MEGGKQKARIGSRTSGCYCQSGKKKRKYLIEETEDLATSSAASCFFVIHNAVGSSQNKVTKLTRGKKVRSPLLDILELNVESGGDDTTLVDSATKLDDDLSGAVIIHNLELANVFCDDRCKTTAQKRLKTGGHNNGKKTYCV
ncbi:hypothetical protein QOT17_010221 [Balamuthia mandrillaris]